MVRLCVLRVVIDLLDEIRVLLQLLVILALGVALRPETLLAALLVGHLIGFEDVLELVDLLHVVLVDALQLTGLESLQEVVGFVFCLFEVVVFSRALRAEMQVALFVVVLAVLRNDPVVVSARLSLRPEVVVLDSSDVLDLGVGCGG